MGTKEKGTGKLALILCVVVVALVLALIGTFGYRLYAVTKTYQSSTDYKTNLENALADSSFNGSVLVAKDGEILYSDGGGISDLDANKLNTRDTTFCVFSVTKQFTGAAILKLQSEGKLSIDDKLSKYFPECSYADRVTLRNMLDMRSGIPEYIGNDEVWNVLGEDAAFQGGTPLTKDKMTETILGYKDLLMEPDSDYAYSNANYYLLGLIIESVSGQTYAEYIQENFLTPCGIKDAGFTPEEAQAKPYDASSLGVGKEYNGVVTFGAGCLDLSVTDLYKWQNALYGNKIPGVDIRSAIADSEGYTCGVHEKDGVFYHNGTGYTGHADVYYDDNSQLQIIVLSNYSDVNTSDIIGKLYNLTVEYLRRKEAM